MFFILGKIFVISDTWINRPCEKHYGENHLEYNMKVISNWNSVVTNEDIVYVLGGFGICDTYDTIFQLNGKKIIFLNNFYSEDEIDSKNILEKYIDRSINDLLKEKISFSPNQIEILKDKDIVLSYFPLIDWYGKKNDSLCFHGMFENTNMNNNNVCCNASKWDFKPIDIDLVKSNIKKFKSFV